LPSHILLFFILQYGIALLLLKNVINSQQKQIKAYITTLLKKYKTKSTHVQQNACDSQSPESAVKAEGLVVLNPYLKCQLGPTCRTFNSHFLVAAVLLNKLWCDYFITKIPGKLYDIRVTGIYL
jgi:hypothetical protein